MITIGDSLKSEAVNEYLELYDINVIYRFDRLYEGEEDSYTVNNEVLGLELKIDKNQKLIVIWIKMVNSISAKNFVQWDNFSSMVDVEKWAEAQKYDIIYGDNWIRADGEMVSYHYAFDANGLLMVTLMSKDIAP